MRAVVYDPQARASLRLADVEEPVAADSEALIDVRATTLNFGEVHFIDQMRKPGEVPGWDAAGVIAHAAADGSGPPVGSRVVGFHGAGGWAERRAVPTENLALLPDSVDFGPAAALPVAGVTALQALRALGPVVGRRVLITGASGGVGRFGVQLAARAGAHVIAAVGPAARGAGLESLGAAEASNQPTTIDFESERRRFVRKRLEPFTVRTPFSPDVAYLVELMAAGELDPQIGLRAPWDDVAEAAEARCSTAGLPARRYWTSPDD